MKNEVTVNNIAKPSQFLARVVGKELLFAFLDRDEHSVTISGVSFGSTTPYGPDVRSPITQHPQYLSVRLGELVSSRASPPFISHKTIAEKSKDTS